MRLMFGACLWNKSPPHPARAPMPTPTPRILPILPLHLPPSVLSTLRAPTHRAADARAMPVPRSGRPGSPASAPSARSRDARRPPLLALATIHPPPPLPPSRPPTAAATGGARAAGARGAAGGGGDTGAGLGRGLSSARLGARFSSSRHDAQPRAPLARRENSHLSYRRVRSATPSPRRHPPRAPRAQRPALPRLQGLAPCASRALSPWPAGLG